MSTKADKNWSALDALTAEEVHSAAMRDPDAIPLTDADTRRMKQTPRVKIIRRAFGISQEAFATHYQIPIGTRRDWEQGRTKPDQAASAYLRIIAAGCDKIPSLLSVDTQI